jgi:hypothetical protein
MISDRGRSVKDFFISYNKADRDWATWIAWTLEEAGFSVVIQAWDFRPGGNFVLEMQRAIQGTEKTIAVLSPDYLASSFTAPEWAAVFAEDPESKQNKLLPILVRKCDPKGLLGPIVYVNLIGLTPESAKAALLGAFRERAKPSSAPDFPGDGSPDTLTVSPTFPGRPTTMHPDSGNLLSTPDENSPFRRLKIPQPRLSGG